MKKVWLALIIFVFTLPIYAQRLATVVIMPFEVSGPGLSANDAGEITMMVITELKSWGTINILPEGEAGNAEYIVKGQMVRQNNQLVVTATTSEARSGRALNNSREQAPNLAALSMVSLCAQIAENVPFPNYLLGKWRSTIETIDGPLNCILEFRSDRTIRVEQYDTWEHSGTDSLRYQAIGDGTYSYAGYLRRTVTIERREIQSDATVGISLDLEDALPKYTSLSIRSLRVLFNNDRNNFELVYGALPCGENHSGPSVHPSKDLFYTRFSKI